jgi:hypothetical protein
MQLAAEQQPAARSAVALSLVVASLDSTKSADAGLNQMLSWTNAATVLCNYPKFP